MKITVLTLEPEIFNVYLNQTILKRANDIGAVDVEIVNIRDYAQNKHKMVDDTPFGGGRGMVLKPEPFFNYFLSNKQKRHVVFVTPQGVPLNQKKVTELSKYENLVIISGRYEGLDERVINSFVDEEISVGDYVLTSGDLPSLILIDSISRQKEGVIQKESYETDSFYNGILGFPQYTKPAVLGRHKVPDVLLSGNHRKINEFREQEAIKKTILNRPDLIEKLKDDIIFKSKLKKYLISSGGEMVDASDSKSDEVSS